MTYAYKILGQSAPVASTYTTLYTVPAATSATVSTVNICNLDATPRNFRLASVKSGYSISTPTSNTFLAYETTIPASDSIALTIGITLAANDSIVVFANSTANIAFTVFGAEIT
jgi:hypothetical protein